MAAKPQKYTIRKLDPGEYSPWDQFVNQCPSGTLFQTAGWASLIQKVSGRSFEIYAAFQEQQIVSGMLCWPKKFLNKQALTQAPVTPYQGIVFRNPESQKTSAIIAEQHELLNPMIDFLTGRFALIDVPFSRGISDVRPFLWKNFEALPMYSYAFPLNDADSLPKQFSQALRRKIKTREKEALTVEESNDTRLLHRYVLDSYRSHKMNPPLDRQALDILFTETLNLGFGRLFYLLKENQKVAALLVLSDENNVYAYFAGLDEQSRKGINTEYLYYHVMTLPEFRGKYFDFLGADLPWFEQFKRSFGGPLKTYYRLRYYRSPLLKLIGELRRQQQNRHRQQGNAR